MRAIGRLGIAVAVGLLWAAGAAPARAQEGPAVPAVPVPDVEVQPLDEMPPASAPPPARSSDAPRDPREAWAVHCYQGAEEVLSLAPLYRVLEVRDNIQDWHYVTEDGTRFAGRVGTNVNCFFERLGHDGHRLAGFLPESLTQPVIEEDADGEAERARLADVPPAEEGDRLTVGLGGERDALGTVEETASAPPPAAEAPTYSAPDTRPEDRPLGMTESVLDRPQTLLAIEGLGAPPATGTAPAEVPAEAPSSADLRGLVDRGAVAAAAAPPPESLSFPAPAAGTRDQPIARRDLRDPRVVPLPVAPPRAWLAAEGELTVQLAAMPSEASARAEWRRLRLRHGAEVARMVPDIGRGERIGGDPVWRIRLQPADRQHAAVLCGTVRRDGGICRLPRGLSDAPALASTMPAQLAPPDLDRPIGLPVDAAPVPLAGEAPAELALSLEGPLAPAAAAGDGETGAEVEVGAAGETVEMPDLALDLVEPQAGGDPAAPAPVAASDRVDEPRRAEPDRPTLDRDTAISVGTVVPSRLDDRGLAWERPVLRADVESVDDLLLSASGPGRGEGAAAPAADPPDSADLAGLAIQPARPILRPPADAAPAAALEGEGDAGDGWVDMPIAVAAAPMVEIDGLDGSEIADVDLSGVEMLDADGAALPTDGGAGELVQLAAHRDHAAALATWGRLTLRHPALAGRDPLVTRVDLGNHGVWHRLQVAVPARADAEVLCQAIHQGGGDCWLVQTN